MTTSTSVKVLIPTPLRGYTNGEATVSASGSSVAAVIDDLESRYPGLKERVTEADGEIRRFVNIFVNGKNVRSLSGAATAVNEGDEIGIIPAMAGGR
jgi:MoaD family protein